MAGVTQSPMKHGRNSRTQNYSAIAALRFSSFFEKALVKMLIESDLLTVYPKGAKLCDGTFLLLHLSNKRASGYWGDVMVTVVLADDHVVVRQGLRALLESDPQFSVVGEAASGA